MSLRFSVPLSAAPIVTLVTLFGLAASASCAQGSVVGTSGKSSAGPGAGGASSESGAGGAVAGAGGSVGAGGSAGACPRCQVPTDCAASAICAQFGGDSFCAPDCSKGQTCAKDRACTQESTNDGNPASVCVPIVDICGGNGSSSAASGAASSSGAAASGAASVAASSGGGNPMVCGSLVGPTVKAGCMSCTPQDTCQANGCFGGWWCNQSSNKCQPAPSLQGCGSGAASTGVGVAASSGASSSSGMPMFGGSIGPNGGTLSGLSFAIVGDTRPPNDNDTAGYPTAVVTKIWQDVEAFNPKPAFAVTTGDYMFNSPGSGQAAPQLNLYLSARNNYANIVFPAFGNHECTGGTTSNCGSGNANGITENYTAFMSMLLQPVGKTSPYYVVNVSGTNNAWTAKFVFIAANAWDSAQASWLTTALSQSTTYTFVIRHERSSLVGTGIAGVDGSVPIIAAHPFTAIIVGHTHTYDHPSINNGREIVVGNGGAPLTSGPNYGYVIALQQGNGNIQFSEYDADTNALGDQFSVSP